MHQNKNREEVKNREIQYLPELSIFNLHSVFTQIILNYYPNYPIHRLYFVEVETPHRKTSCGSGFIVKHYHAHKFAGYMYSLNIIKWLDYSLHGLVPNMHIVIALINQLKYNYYSWTSLPLYPELSCFKRLKSN